MKIVGAGIAIGLAIGVGLGICACSTDKNSAPIFDADDLAAIERVRNQLAEGVRTGNPYLMLSTYDQSVILMSPNEPPIVGLEQSRIWLEAAFSEPYPDATYETAEVQINGNWAFERGSYWEGAGKRLWIYRRQPDGGWKISHIMWSSNSPAPPTE